MRKPDPDKACLPVLGPRSASSWRGWGTGESQSPCSLSSRKDRPWNTCGWRSWPHPYTAGIRFAPEQKTYTVNNEVFFPPPCPHLVNIPPRPLTVHYLNQLAHIFYFNCLTFFTHYFNQPAHIFNINFLPFFPNNFNQPAHIFQFYYYYFIPSFSRRFKTISPTPSPILIFGLNTP